MFALYRRQWFLVLAFACLSSISGVIGYRYPPLALGFMGIAVLLTAGMVLPGVLSRLFLGMLAVLLIGYAFLGRSFAYLGSAPVFVGELVLGVGLLTVLVHRERWAAFRSPVAWLLAAFALWGAARTFPYLAAYRVDALRDAVVWGYGVFALLLVPLLLQKRLVERAPDWYAACIPWFLAWAPVALSIHLTMGERLPFIPGTHVAVLHVKPGDFAVHLGGVAAFLLLGLHRMQASETAAPNLGRRMVLRGEWFWWILWLATLVAITSLNRGGMLAMLVALSVVLLLRPTLAGRRLAWIGAIVLVFTLALLAFDISFERRGQRDISPRQVVVNMLSISGSGPTEENLSGTRRWRIMWWEKIMGYTVHGEYFWSGKGYGINLAVDDGFAGSSGFLRSPHNGHLTVLARSGVPGAVLWIVLQAGFAVALLLTYFRARRNRQERVASMSTWILAYWAAFMVNASFDVALEGPQAGIWFWSLFGLGLALMLEQQGGSGQNRLIMAEPHQFERRGSGPFSPAGRALITVPHTSV